VTRLAIVGAGYVGLVTGACLAETGIQVVCVDLSAKRVAEINQGSAPFHEPGLDELLTRTAGHGLSATTDLAAAVRGADVIMLAVGTPSRDGAIDLTQVREAAKNVGTLLDTAAAYPVVVVKSTVVPGTTRDVVTPILEAASGRTAGEGFGVGVNPEFLTEGTAIDDFAHPDRIVVGAEDPRSAEAIAGLYAAFQGVPLLRVNTATAEMIKYASNTLLATLISFTNELANLGQAVGDVDTVEVMRGVHASRYLTSQVAGSPPTAAISSFLGAGTGYGGSCLPKDTQALIARGAELGQEMRILRAVEAVNHDQAGELVRLVTEAVGDLHGARVTVLGLSFKPDTDDVRESPAFRVIPALVEGGAVVTAHDPIAIVPARRVLGDLPVTYEPDLAAALANAHAVVIVTRWREYEAVPALIAGRTPPVPVVDGRRMLAPDSVERYSGIGR
jgi:UDPglucose 6-dehydrogenase/GDP-mannose 6-dehydrogenase